MKNTFTTALLSGLVLVLMIIAGASLRRAINLEAYSTAAYKDGFEAGSKTATCDEKKEAAFNEGVMNGLQRAKTMCGITIRREIK